VIDCLECRAEFKDSKSLHLHLKKHGGQAAYYAKWYPRYDLKTRELIDFENADQYLNSLFNSPENRWSYLNAAGPEQGADLILEEFNTKVKQKNIKYSLPQNWFVLNELADISSIKKFFGSYKNFCEKASVENIFKTKIPNEFFTKKQEFEDIFIFIDTREQKPFHFKNGIINKLDFGDYTGSGEFYSKTFVDRKSLSDFKGTFGKGYERFKSEMNRCKEFDSYLFLVVEATIDEIVESNQGKFKTNLSYCFHNVRDCILEYPKNIQFIFCKNRNQAEEITKRIIYYGDELWSCDVQYFLDLKNYGSNQRRTRLSV
jgi:hypothetical protein